MTRKMIGRAAFIATMGFLIFAAGPTHAAPPAEGDAPAEQTSTAGKPLALTKAKKSRVHKAGRTAAKLVAIKAEKKAKRAGTTAPIAEKRMPEAIANANAQMPSAEARGAAIAEMPALEAAAAEQLTELGKSLTTPAIDEPQQMAQLSAPESPQGALPLVAPEPTRPPKQARVTSSSNDAWAQSSLIGKILIAFGGMLTLASAARMLVA